MDHGELDGFQNELDDLFGTDGRSDEQPTGPPPDPQLVEPPRLTSHRSQGRSVGTIVKSLVPAGALGGVALALHAYLSPAGEGEPLATATLQQPIAEPLVVESTPQQPAVQVLQVEAQPEQIPEDEAVLESPLLPLTGRFGIQVAICSFSQCVREFQDRLARLDLASEVTQRSATLETAEVYTETPFSTAAEAGAFAELIDRAYGMRGQVYVFRQAREFHVALGRFNDEAHANTVRDALNRMLRRRATFATRIRRSSYELEYVVAGHFESRQQAEAARARLVQTDTLFNDSYVIER
jgi:hypothetical protein